MADRLEKLAELYPDEPRPTLSAALEALIAFMLVEAGLIEPSPPRTNNDD